VGLTKRLLDAAKTPVDPLTIRSPSAGRTSHAMRAAEALQFDVIVAEDLDRLFRSQADYHTSRATLDFQGVKIHTVAHGHVGNSTAHCEQWWPSNSLILTNGVVSLLAMRETSAATRRAQDRDRPRAQSSGEAIVKFDVNPAAFAATIKRLEAEQDETESKLAAIASPK
jgi:DNA invertase Pin-like site-specific DNA recombinase